MGVDVGELYQLHASDLIRFATMLVGPSDAADVVSEAMVGVLASPTSDGVRDGRGYLFRSVSNAAMSYHRSRKRRERRELRAVAANPVATPVDVTVAGASVVAREVLAGLSLQQRSVLFLAYWMDLPPAEIADLLGVSEGTVRKQLARSRALLRRRFDEEEVAS